MTSRERGSPAPRGVRSGPDPGDRGAGPSFKVCCIRTADEMEQAKEAGATWAGLVGAMPSGPGPLPDERIRAMVPGVPGGITPVLLTARATAGEIAGHLEATGLAARLRRGRSVGVQLVRHLDAPVRRELKELLPGLAVLQVLHVDGPAALDRMEGLARHADLLLLDSGRPGAAVAELGGTGRTHDWSVSRRIVARASVPVLLAGGLRPGNVAAAVRAVRPSGVDVCSGLRDPKGALVPGRLRAFARALRSA